MCNFDDYDGLDDDFSEDAFMENYDDLDMENELPDETASQESEASESVFDIEDAFIIGGMIGGMAYEEALAEKEGKKKKRTDEE